ncbi:esterase/lipase family protein [Gordonia sp. (in: high G+C Gram-positive bacteria)]|uniref:esterase/lipase family protein n=1 Tax=Gordonia sp. (in: high G+C Gram-positive bacteria) TaxID=84139 RepID=UPI003C717222
MRSTLRGSLVALVSVIVMCGAAAQAGPALAVPGAESADAAAAQRLTDYINAGSPAGRRAVNGFKHDADWSGPTRKLPPIPSTVGVGPRQTGFWPAFAYSQVNPRVAPPGANDWSCKPKAGQNPVVLLHGTWENAYDNWAAFAPVLKKAGYCVFTPNYGRTDLLDVGGLGTILPGTNGVAKVGRSAEQIDPYITKVLAKTGAKKINLIGHSQGGLLARYWMKRFNGHLKVDKLITYGATNNGTTLDGIGWLGRSINNVGLDVLAPVTLLVGSAGIDQTIDSPTVKYVNNRAPFHDGGQKRVYPDVEYTIVGSRYDEVTTPYDLTFLPGYRNVKNITLQNGCEQDTSDHISMSYSPRALSIALHTLDPQRYPKLVCSSSPWFFSF